MYKFYLFNLWGALQKKVEILRAFFQLMLNQEENSGGFILQPLNSDKEPYVPCNIDEIAGIVKIVEIAEVSKHYE